MEQILLGAGLIALCVLAVKAPKIFRSKDPVKTASALVVARRADVSNSTYSTFQNSKIQYWITFRLEEETMELSVSSSQYSRILEGAQGQLTWQDKTLVSFEPES